MNARKDVPSPQAAVLVAVKIAQETAKAQRAAA